MRELTREDLYDILLGATIVGTGGGGTLEEGIEVIDKALNEGYSFMLASDDDIPDDALVGTPYGCGSISPFTEEQQEEFDKADKISISQETAAMRVLEKYYNREFYGVIATELGGFNTAVALEAGARLGKPIIDADPAGRSVPCLQHTTYYLKDIPIAPMGLANQLGDELILTNAANDERAESIVRSVAVASFNSVGVVDHPGEWRVIREALHHNTISWCLNIGRAARKEISAGRNFVDKIVEDFDGYHIFEGEISNVSWEDKDGFTYGDIIIDGKGDYAGNQLKIWYQNENIISWLNGEYYVMSPDLINIVNCDINMPLLNPYAEIGMNVKVFGFRARDEWRKKKGLDILGPRFFNFDIDYVPIEEIV